MYKKKDQGKQIKDKEKREFKEFMHWMWENYDALCSTG